MDPGLKTLRRPDARFKTKSKKLRSGLDLTHYPTDIGADVSVICKLCRIPGDTKRKMRLSLVPVTSLF